jgi:hypothetical protein
LILRLERCAVAPLAKGSMMKLVVLAALLVFPFAAAAQPARSIADCEKIKGDLAYNQCLASFGPKIGERRGGRVAAPAEDGEPVVTRGRRGRSGYARRGGRQRAVFEVGRGRQTLRVSPTWRASATRKRRR